LAPLAGEVGSPSAIRVRGPIRESNFVEAAPHPNRQRASFGRLDPRKSGAREPPSLAANSPAGIAWPTALKGQQSNGVLHAGSLAPVGCRNGFADQVEKSL